MTHSAKYQEYRVQQQDPSKKGAKRALKSVRDKVLFDGVLLPYALYQHQQLLRDRRPMNDHTYTCFMRAPSQMKLLLGPVMEFLGRRERLDILLLACSSGAEAYTIASELKNEFPDLDFHIRASDLHSDMVEQARQATYSRAEVLHSDYITGAFIERTFDLSGETYVVKPEIRQHVSFSCADMLDAESLHAQFDPAPIVVAQNVLFHFDPENMRRAFANVVSLMEPRGVLLAEGMDLDLRVELTKQHGLDPLTQDLRQVYEETRVHTPSKWWNYYWGTEPFLPFRAEPGRRYATIFLREGGECDMRKADRPKAVTPAVDA